MVYSWPSTSNCALLDDAVWQAVEPLEQAQLIEQAQGDRVHGVAAEVAQEVGVLLQHGHVDAGARQHQSQKQSRRAAPDDRACRRVTHVSLTESRLVNVNRVAGRLQCGNGIGVSISLHEDIAVS